MENKLGTMGQHEAFLYSLSKVKKELEGKKGKGDVLLDLFVTISTLHRPVIHVARQTWDDPRDMPAHLHQTLTRMVELSTQICRGLKDFSTAIEFENKRKKERKKSETTQRSESRFTQ